MVYNSLVFRWEVLQISMELRLLTMSHERIPIPRGAVREPEAEDKSKDLSFIVERETAGYSY